MKRTPSKRDAVMDAALALFNDAGTAPVTTNHIARAAGVSPGNLYYHFRNKEAIIRALYEQFLSDYNALWQGLFHGGFDAGAILDVVTAGFDVNAKYRFIALELVALCRHDPALMALQRAAHTERFATIREVVARGVESGVFIRPDDEQLDDDLIHLVWLINQYWLSYVHLQDDTPTEAAIERGLRLALRVIAPHLNPVFREKLGW